MWLAATNSEFRSVVNELQLSSEALAVAAGESIHRWSLRRLVVTVANVVFLR